MNIKYRIRAFGSQNAEFRKVRGFDYVNLGRGHKKRVLFQTLLKEALSQNRLLKISKLSRICVATILLQIGVKLLWRDAKNNRHLSHNYHFVGRSMCCGFNLVIDNSCCVNFIFSQSHFIVPCIKIRIGQTQNLSRQIVYLDKDIRCVWKVKPNNRLVIKWIWLVLINFEIWIRKNFCIYIVVTYCNMNI